MSKRTRTLDELLAEKDQVAEPFHYTRGSIEVTDFIDDQKLDFQLGVIVQYICRSPHKGQELMDLKKAKWYLDRRIAQKEAQDAAV